MGKNIIWFLPAGMVVLGIFLLSTFLSYSTQLEGAGYSDKIEHCFAYFVLTISFLIAFKKSGLLTKRLSIKLIILASLYGFGLELVQFFCFSYRVFEWIDATANVLGVLIGFSIFTLFNRG